MSRRSSAVAGVVKYIFKGITDLDENLTPMQSALARSLQRAGVVFTQRDIELETKTTIEKSLDEAIKGMPEEESLDYLLHQFNTDDIAKDLEQGVVSPYVFTHNLISQTLEGYIEEFKENDSIRIYKRKDQSVGHVVLSWSGIDRGSYMSIKYMIC